MKKLVPVLGAVVLLIAFSSITLAQKAHRGWPFVGTRTFCDTFDVDRSKVPGGRSPKVLVSIRKDGFTTVKTDIYGEGYGDTGTLFGKPYTFSGKVNAKWVVKRSSDTFLVLKSTTTVSYSFGQDGFDMKMCEAPPKESNHAQLAPSVVTDAVLVFSDTQARSSPAKFDFLVGEWEARTSSNHYRMRVEWDKDNNQFRGFLTKQGEVSAAVGFRVGEHVWTAQPIGEPDIVVELQKWRSGSNGASTRVEWKIGEVDIERSSANALVTSITEFSRVK